ncbi:MAG: hypothetical protein KDA52_21340, partial [Planctomycetaceae bacterium]|nr:hypothetical protein [Planctomycetaceae bacterium]
GKILLNADGTRSIRVELLDENFQPLPDFSGTNAGVTDADGGLDCPIRWPKNFTSLQGRSVRVKVELTQAGDPQPRLYAVSVRAG